MAALLGPMLVLGFCLAQALRDVHFASVFQDVDYFAVILLAFVPSTLVFAAITALWIPGDLVRMRRQAVTILAMNAVTALAWTCYFFALVHLEPAVVNTVHSGVAPLTVVALGAFGSKLAKPGGVGRQESLAYAGIALALVGLWWVVLSGRSGLPNTDHATALVGLMLVVVSGTSITVSLLYAKRLHDAGISAVGITAVRYPALILLAAAVVAAKGRLAGVEGLGDVATLSVAAIALIALPLFGLQVGVALTAPLTAHVIRALGPVCVFALQQIDGRLTYSTSTLVCIIAYSAFAIAGNFAHGWRAPDNAVVRG